MMPRNADNTWTSDALQRDDADAIRGKVLEDPNYIHERVFVGDTPLLTATAFGNLELVRFLLKHGADPNVEVDDGSPFSGSLSLFLEVRNPAGGSCVPASSAVLLRQSLGWLWTYS